LILKRYCGGSKIYHEKMKYTYFKVVEIISKEIEGHIAKIEFFKAKLKLKPRNSNSVVKNNLERKPCKIK
jgi:hypothetical protein